MGELQTLDLIIALVAVFDVVTGHFLGQRQLRMAEQMPEPQDRELMRQRAQRSRVMLMYVSPLLLLAVYLLWLRPATV